MSVLTLEVWGRSRRKLIFITRGAARALSGLPLCVACGAGVYALRRVTGGAEAVIGFGHALA